MSDADCTAGREPRSIATSTFYFLNTCAAGWFCGIFVNNVSYFGEETETYVISIISVNNDSK